MINTTELRRNNLVTDEWYDSFKTILKVDSINEKGINLEIVDDGNWSEIAQRWIEPEYRSDTIFPIPINEDMLLNCKQYTKWEWFGDEWWGGYIPFIHGTKLMLRNCNGKFIFTVCTLNKKHNTYISIRKIKLPINSIHELQNLFKSIRGEELVFFSNNA